MRYTRLGRRGPRISVVGLGFWQAGSTLWRGRDPGVVESVKRGVEIALGLGVNFFDTAEIYGWGRSERILGEALARAGSVRGDVEPIVASKVAGFRTTRHSVVKAAEASKRRLGRTIDLLQYHWPPPYYARLCSIIRGLEDAVDRGLAAYIGLSNFPRGLLAKALECTRRYELVSNQVQYSLAYRSPENHLKPYMEEKGLTLIAWSPLAKGALAGKTVADAPALRGDKVFRDAARDEELQEALRSIAEKHGATRAQVALAWLIAKNAVPIPGYRRAKRVEENAGAAELQLSREDIELLDKASWKYRKRYGECYSSLRSMRLIPGFLQYLAIRGLGGI